MTPPALAAGARVALVAPAGPLLELDDLRRAEELCRALGFVPVAGTHALAQHGYLAGTDAERLEDLNRALTADDVDAVWCLRGGYGVTRILDRVDFAGFARRPRVVLGYSDVTALLNALWARTGVVSFHSPVAREPMTPFARDGFARIATRAVPAGELPLPSPPESVLVPAAPRVVPLREGIAEGPLLGGNLTLLQCLIGTRFMPRLDGAILFLEDVGEDLYRVDRMLSHFRLAGVLDRLAGVAIGRFTEIGRRGADGAWGLDRVLRHYFEPLGIPAVFGFPIGHLDEQWTLPLGPRARLDAGLGRLEILEPAVC